MTGPKLNDGVTLLDGQVTTRATARYLRGSASKARAVLDLIRGLDVRRADEVLQFTERAAAADVRKVLASAVANAVHNDARTSTSSSSSPATPTRARRSSASARAPGVGRVGSTSGPATSP